MRMPKQPPRKLLEVQRKALVVKFRNAAVFRNRKPSSDKIFFGETRIPRREAPMIAAPEGTLDERHVANLLHVLMGERPVPSFRPSMATADADIKEAAKGARFRMDEVSSMETKTCRKAVNDCWQTETNAYLLNGKSVAIKGGHLYARRLKRFLGEDLFERFEALAAIIAKESKIKRRLDTQQSIELLNAHGKDKRVAAFTQACRDAKRTDLANIIDPKGNNNSISLQSGTGTKLNVLLVGSGPETVSRYSGTIYVPIKSEALLNRLNNGSGFGTLLEGGFASIVGIEDWSNDLIHDSKPVTLHPIKGHVPVKTS
jgi:hypothetical protein